MEVILKPQIECLDSSWRGMIAFPHEQQQLNGVEVNRWPIWFASYQQAILHYADLAERNGFAFLTIAQELQGAELLPDLWLPVIDAVRQRYTGTLVVNAQGDRAVRHDPLFHRWVQELDLIGFSNYQGVKTKVSAQNPLTVAMVEQTMQATIREWRDLAKLLGKRIYWAECGCRSVVDGHILPWEYRNIGAYDGNIQANYIEGFLRAFAAEPWWAGYQLWKWDEQQARPHYRQPGGDTGFTIHGKPAAERLASINAFIEHQQNMHQGVAHVSI